MMGVPLLVIVATLVKLLFEATIFRHLQNPELTPLKKSALLMTGPLLATTLVRFFFAILGGIGFPLLAIIHGPLVPLLVLTFVFSLIAEILERNLFFAAVVGHKMPGGVRV
ncbi:MAG: hypothetical protein JNM63_10955 [Spirochaetia bacterium]|nr:hypothetical protein [Spirochaetia bacterium]